MSKCSISTWLIAGPYCTKLFADYGAEVIKKIKQTGEGDPAPHRAFPQDDPHPEKVAFFLHLNTNKRGVTLNLKSDTGKALFRELVEDADILVESFSPRVMQSLGFDYESLEKISELVTGVKSKLDGLGVTPKRMVMKRLLLLCSLLLPAVGFTQQYSIGWHKIAGGGGASSGGVYSVNGTIGQPDAGSMSGEGYSLEGGFWSVVAGGQASGAPPLTVQQTSTNTIVITWPATAGNWVLQESATGAAGTWTNVSMLAVLVGGTMQVILPASESANQFRLVAAPAAPQLEIALGAANSVHLLAGVFSRMGIAGKPDPCAQLLDELDRGAGTRWAAACQLRLRHRWVTSSIG